MLSTNFRNLGNVAFYVALLLLAYAVYVVVFLPVDNSAGTLSKTDSSSPAFNHHSHAHL